VSTRAPERPAPTPAASPQIDPRIRARRIEVQRDAGRKRLRRLGIGGGVVGGVVMLWGLTLTPLLDVDTIRIEGADRTGDEPVLDALDIRHGDALLTVDVDGASRAVSDLPWVATASVRRSWPGTVVVSVVERTPVAAIEATGDGWVLVDAGGRQLAVEREPAVDLVRVAGRPLDPAPGVAAGDRYTGALHLAAAIPPSLRARIQALWPQRDGSVEASVSLPIGGTATARFGDGDQLEAKLVALAAVLERADLHGVRFIDLRVPAAPALTRG